MMLSFPCLLSHLKRPGLVCLSRVDIFDEQRRSVKHFACGPASCYDTKNHNPYQTGGRYDPHTRSMALAAHGVKPSAVPQSAPGRHARALEPGHRPDAERRIDHSNGMHRPAARTGRTDGARTVALLVPTCFAPLLRWVVAWWHPDHTHLPLVLDASPLGQRFTILTICVVMRGCALPVAWTVVEATKTCGKKSRGNVGPIYNQNTRSPGNTNVSR
jgi:hypothetical protein